MTEQTVLNLGPAIMPDFMTGAAFFSILAWPTMKETVSFHRVSEELAADTIRLTNAPDPRSVEPVIEQWPQHDWRSLLVRSRKPRPATGYLHKRLKQRMAAGRAGLGKTHEQIFGIPAVLPAGMTGLSIDQLCRLIRSDVVIDDPENIEKHVWRTSLPILHLAMAAQLILTGKHGDRAELGCNLQDIDFFREAVRIAGKLEQVVHDHTEIAMTHDKMTLIRWFE